MLRCRQLGINAIVILEQFGELEVLLDVAARLGVAPIIGRSPTSAIKFQVNQESGE